MTRVQSRYGEIVSNFKGEMDQRSCGEDVLRSVERMVNGVIKTLVKTLHEHSDFSLYTSRYHLPDHLVEIIRLFGTLSIFGQHPIRAIECAHLAGI